jgi:hypothetical protein
VPVSLMYKMPFVESIKRSPIDAVWIPSGFMSLTQTCISVDVFASVKIAVPVATSELTWSLVAGLRPPINTEPSSSIVKGVISDNAFPLSNACNVKPEPELFTFQAVAVSVLEALNVVAPPGRIESEVKLVKPSGAVRTLSSEVLILRTCGTPVAEVTSMLACPPLDKGVAINVSDVSGDSTEIEAPFGFVFWKRATPRSKLLLLR